MHGRHDGFIVGELASPTVHRSDDRCRATLGRWHSARTSRPRPRPPNLGRQLRGPLDRRRQEGPGGSRSHASLAAQARETPACPPARLASGRPLPRSGVRAPGRRRGPSSERPLTGTGDDPLAQDAGPHRRGPTGGRDLGCRARALGRRAPRTPPSTPRTHRGTGGQGRQSPAVERRSPDTERSA